MTHKAVPTTRWSAESAMHDDENRIGGTMSDAQFDELLRPWLGGAARQTELRG